ncbi:hypothetical protein KBZ18_11465 [Synechococcus sp. Cruz-9H2]|uniref:hypothetical protein n=1 Tax=unclassified Synechococcus TaxID=2626047 RepID=UPI0020CD1807|nr:MULTISPECIES: hypothetical protein [unclassified Synechococcus]MCP9820104.1 hypothetical protein [Synechococcus sp. Cruz-9H2]MCP9844469.1 hypothetical protein [Synechococcus sp. Edmonson 11F2]MCP9856534.1 hypothetical protein [Synechococcus sp. Cruz-9C9]MCP9863819.1 hypothetical protein [Synechococcus sp. Cruz-7E5]MCP9871073.1 hypothetical protein [Synechococcus sp. Cruz-7B9]
MQLKNLHQPAHWNGLPGEPSRYRFPDKSCDGDKPSPAMVDDKQPKNVADFLAGLDQVMIHSNLLDRYSTEILDSELDHTADHFLLLLCTDSPGRAIICTARTLGLPG